MSKQSAWPRRSFRRCALSETERDRAAMKRAANAATLHPPLAAYSHQIEVSGPVRWLVMSGQVGQMPDGTIPDDSVEQLEVALANVGSNLAAAGMGAANLVKLTIYLVGAIDVERRRSVLAAWLDGHEPCMTLLFVAALAAPTYRVEIDAWACDSD
jgi:2-iminobutanoate/2-iminopropanoate deaminase